MPQISLIMPVYNTDEKYLRKSIESILAQIHNDFELIIVDDGSQNSAKDVIFSYQDERIRYFYQCNKGLSAARNVGLSFAQGEYVLFVDSDDWLDENACSIALEKAKTLDLDVLFYGVDSCNDKTGKMEIWDNFRMFILSDSIESPFDFRHPIIFDNLFKINATAWAQIFKRKFLVENNLLFTEGLIFEDMEFFYRFILRASKIGLIEDVCYYYRTNVDNSIIDKKDKKYFDILQIFQLIEQTLFENNLFEELEVKFYHFKLATISYRYKNINKELKKEFKHAISKDLNADKRCEKNLRKLSLTSQLTYKYFTSSSSFVYWVLLKPLKFINRIRSIVRGFIKSYNKKLIKYLGKGQNA